MKIVFGSLCSAHLKVTHRRFGATSLAQSSVKAQLMWLFLLKFPFASNGGKRACCGTRTYDTDVMQCCDQGWIQRAIWLALLSIQGHSFRGHKNHCSPVKNETEDDFWLAKNKNSYNYRFDEIPNVYNHFPGFNINGRKFIPKK